MWWNRIDNLYFSCYNKEEKVAEERKSAMQPLADKMRPRELSEMVGQAHLVGERGALRRIVEGGHMTNMIFYGPPGTGKTTAANILAAKSGST